MGLPEDLLEQAQFLAQREQRRPRQASLRRAVSTSYYAVFHLLSASSASQASPAVPVGLSDRVQRSLEHGSMKEAAKRFESGTLPDHIRPFVTNPMPATSYPLRGVLFVCRTRGTKRIMTSHYASTARRLRMRSRLQLSFSRIGMRSRTPRTPTSSSHP